MNILVIKGSLNPESTSSMVAEHIEKMLCNDASLTVKELDVRTFSVPYYRPEEHWGENASFDKLDSHTQKLLELLKWADAFIISTPDYHGSVSGVLKNVLDHGWLEFGAKLFGYVVSGHDGGHNVISSLQTSIRNSHGWSMPYFLSVSDEEVSKEMVSPDLNAKICMFCNDFPYYAKLLADAYCEREDNENSFCHRYIKVNI
ncbi:NADPH-dependent FMN reductase [Photobacterium leiognathi]|uniref:NADPH-dependent FMN reductase n=1 Tax=Photobacterium leiognathi TaxID=553611 RepID=UPI0029814AC6|nr:NAD(P)H-dependent oxidoreductase [Photobacterium leiognathi]